MFGLILKIFRFTNSLSNDVDLNNFNKKIKRNSYILLYFLEKKQVFKMKICRKMSIVFRNGQPFSGKTKFHGSRGLVPRLNSLIFDHLVLRLNFMTNNCFIL